MNIPLKEYLELAIRHNDYAIVDSARKLEMESEDASNDPRLVHWRQVEGQDALWQAWRPRAWLMSAERRSELQAASQNDRTSSCARNEIKAAIVVKLKKALGIGDSTPIIPILEMLALQKRSNEALLKGLGLTEEEIDVL